MKPGYFCRSRIFVAEAQGLKHLQSFYNNSTHAHKQFSCIMAHFVCFQPNLPCLGIRIGADDLLQLMMFVNSLLHSSNLNIYTESRFHDSEQFSGSTCRRPAVFIIISWCVGVY